jgi:hypothetical protein
VTAAAQALLPFADAAAAGMVAGRSALPTPFEREVMNRLHLADYATSHQPGGHAGAQWATRARAHMLAVIRATLAGFIAPDVPASLTDLAGTVAGRSCAAALGNLGQKTTGEGVEVIAWGVTPAPPRPDGKPDDTRRDNWIARSTLRDAVAVVRWLPREKKALVHVATPALRPSYDLLLSVVDATGSDQRVALAVWCDFMQEQGVYVLPSMWSAWRRPKGKVNVL